MRRILTVDQRVKLETLQQQGRNGKGAHDKPHPSN
jgi:hypothetical protein